MQAERKLAKEQTIVANNRASGSTGATVTAGETVKYATIANTNKNQRRLQDVGTLRHEEFGSEPVSVDEIVPGLYLGMCASVCDTKKL